MAYLKEFVGFLKEYNVVALAIALMIGIAAQDLVRSFVNNIIMPFINPLLVGEWQEASIFIGQVEMLWGPFLSALINFIIIALVVFLIAKKILHEEKVGKK